MTRSGFVGAFLTRNLSANGRDSSRTPGYCRRAAVALLIVSAMVFPSLSHAQWSAEPGERVRNEFGPEQTRSVHACRGACGMDCPSSCETNIVYECADGDSLRRVRTYTCGTHQGCRAHDDCLDRCAQQQAQGYDCATECNTQAIADYGIELAGPWALGSGPFDGEIVFEYTRDAPGAPEAAYRCPAGTERVCDESGARCLAAGSPVAPVFDAYLAEEPGVLQVSGFKSGRVCIENGQPSNVCETTVDIDVIGDATCDDDGSGTPCTWYGFEFEFANADPSQPLVCRSSGPSEGFLGEILENAIRAAPAKQGTQLGDLLGQLKNELENGSSLSDMLSGITITPNGSGGQVLGAPEPAQATRKPGVPRNVTFNDVAGRMFVPMYEIRDGSAQEPTMVREIRCTHRGSPVLETTFRLNFRSG